jgi:hypothetical protein
VRGWGYSPPKGSANEGYNRPLEVPARCGAECHDDWLTGRKTFVDPQGDLHNVLENCLEAKVLLLNPYSEEARIRAPTLHPSEAMIEDWSEQLRSWVQFLTSLKLTQKNIKLKLYPDYPHVNW